MSITPNGATIKVGQQLQLASSGGGGTKWSSSHPGVATVDSKGLARGVAPGTATITAKKGSQKESAPLVVEALTPTPLPPEPTPVPPDPTPVPPDSTGLPPKPSALPPTSGAISLLDDFAHGNRIVQPNEPSHLKYLWNLYTDNGTPGCSVTELVTIDGEPVLRNRFDQSKAGRPPGDVYGSNWQFYFYPYILDGAHGMSPSGWHYAREFAANYPAAGKMNRLRFQMFVPKGTLPSIDNNFQFGTFLRERADSYLSAESNNWHFYHFGNHEHTGEWLTVVIDTKPQHQRQLVNVEPGDKLHPSTATPLDTYFDLLTAWYLDYHGNRWPAPVDIYVRRVEFYEETRPENVAQVSSMNGVFLRATKELRLQWYHERGNGTTKHEVRWADSDIHALGWDNATPVPAGLVPAPTSANPNAFVERSDALVPPFDLQYTRMEYRTKNVPTDGKSVVYFAVKPQGATLFRQFVIPL